MVEIDNTPLKAFDERVVAFLDELSSTLMKSSASRLYPDIMAFAFYIRKANIQNLRAVLFPEPSQSNNQTIEQSNNSCRLGRGLCFHIAPSNIPINFAFSWVFSLLAGNANIVRLPSKDFPQVSNLLSVVDDLLSRNSEPGTRNFELRTRNAFVRYPRTDNETTAHYSSIADCRMIWGGDHTIASIRALPTKPRCVDVTFADRYSVAMIDGAAVLAAEDAKIVRLAQDFYNDTFLMDQNACSSPQLILWQNDSLAARTRFWNAVYEFASSKYVLQDAVSVDKLTALCEEAVTNSNIASIVRRGNLIARVELKKLDSDVVNHRGKAGLFFEYSLKSFDEFRMIVTEKFQTVTQFGVDGGDLAVSLARGNCRGVDRIVPIGKAMDIGAVWDGYDLIRTLSRVVSF